MVLPQFRIVPLLCTTLALAWAAPVKAQGLSSPLLDQIVFGAADSEQSHGLDAQSSETAMGLLNEPARRLMPLTPQSWEGGKMAFKIKVDPSRQNYLTARFSGDEVNEDFLFLFCEGKQVGYRHLGDVDVLALPDDEPRYNGRFYYVTTPLPIALTRGKSEVSLEIRSSGPIWGYGNTWEKYQKPMSKPSRGIYRLYTHTDGSFLPPSDEKQGQTPRAEKRSQPGPEVLEQVKERANKSLGSFLASTKPLNQMQVQFLARAYDVPWTSAYHSRKAIAQIVASVDQLYWRFKSDPEELWNDKVTWNPGWFGVGPGADAVRRVGARLEGVLDRPLDGEKTRREAWSQMFQASRDWLRTHRRWLANQAMFTDVNLYLCNRGVAAIDPANALPEEKALGYLYQSIGLEPWLGCDTASGPEKPFGESFFQVTPKGLTRERGYVGGYGEGGLEGAMDIYEATREKNGEGDAKIKAQLIKMARARAPFRYPMLDEENHPAMRLETAVGWRDMHVPGQVTYAQRGASDHWVLEIAAATLDPELVGYVQQMFEDNQFFATVAYHLTKAKTGLRPTIGLLNLPGDYELLQSQPASAFRLPMSWDQPDSVFSDEEDGVIALKHGREIFYASLYWRAGYGINSLGRVHYLTPNYQQLAVVHENEVKFEPSGQSYQRRDWINFGFANGGTHIRYPSDIHQAMAGEILPVAKSPEGVIPGKTGDESYWAGKADFYSLRFGPYLIGMNTSAEKKFEIKVPEGAKSIKELVSKREGIVPGSTEVVRPRSTVVYYIE